VPPELLLTLAAIIVGLVNWILLWRADLVLSHYDAKAHLVVARRIVDNVTPGWQQIGGVWLPLPHLLSALPVQMDVLYRTGAFASLVSIVCLAILVFATARLVRLATGSPLGVAVAGALILLNPNLLYLHATPMTEPLLLAATSLAILWLVEWVPQNQDEVPPRLGWALFAAAWTRYEAWLVIAGALPAALYACHRLGASRVALVRRACTLAGRELSNMEWNAFATGLELQSVCKTVKPQARHGSAVVHGRDKGREQLTAFPHPLGVR